MAEMTMAFSCSASSPLLILVRRFLSNVIQNFFFLINNMHSLQALGLAVLVAPACCFQANAFPGLHATTLRCSAAQLFAGPRSCRASTPLVEHAPAASTPHQQLEDASPGSGFAGGGSSAAVTLLPRRTLLQLVPAAVAGGVGMAGAGSAGASVVPRALQELTDECETDACITKGKRVFKRVGRKFEITQEFGSSKSRSTGSAVWEGDVVLTKYMESELPEGYWQGKKILELGAGTGFASFVAALLGSKCVITDGDARVLELARTNANANLTPEEQALLEYDVLKWELAADPEWKYDKGQTWDVILAADVTYYRQNVPPLTRMMQRLAGPNTEIFLAHTIRPTDGDSMESFKRYFDVEKVTSGPSFDGHKDTFIYRMRAKPGAGDGGAQGDLKNDGCNPGYVKNKAVNLCVPASTAST